MKKKILTYPIIIAFALFLFFVLGMSIMTPSVLIDENENRELAQKPLLNEMTSLDQFANDWDSYVSDQFPLRNEIVETVDDVEEIQGSTVVEEVYTIDSDYLFMFTYPLESWRAPTIARLMLGQEAKTSVPFIYVVMPYKNILLADAVDGLSSSTEEANRREILGTLEEAGVTCIDVSGALGEYSLEERSKMFYKSDVHWTDKGAYEGSSVIANALADMGIVSRSAIPHESDFVWSDYTGRSFTGDIAQRQGTDKVFNEYIPVYEIADKDSCYYFTSLNGSEVERETLIGAGLEGDGTLNYSLVSIRNYPYVRVENPHANVDMSVLIIKDSFQCATIDYFTQMFTEVNIVDPRYDYSDHSLESVMESRDVDLVLCMFHCNNASPELIQYIKWID